MLPESYSPADKYRKFNLNITVFASLTARLLVDMVRPYDPALTSPRFA
jgi:hypothetical protein